jgi:hypothetical protein
MIMPPLLSEFTENVKMRRIQSSAIIAMGQRTL